MMHLIAVNLVPRIPRMLVVKMLRSKFHHVQSLWYSMVTRSPREKHSAMFAMQSGIVLSLPLICR